MALKAACNNQKLDDDDTINLFSGLIFIMVNIKACTSISSDVPGHGMDRLDTVEEVTEPASSEFCPDEDEAARIGSSGQPSSDFQQDSLPPDQASLSGKNSKDNFRTV